MLPQSNDNDLHISKSHILIIVALREEFEYVVSSLDVTAEPVPGKHLHYRFQLRTHGGEAVTITIAFVDKMDSSYASTFTLELLQDIKPELLVNIGISGLVDDDLHLGDVVVAQSAYNVTYRSKIVGKKGRRNKNRAPSFDDLVLGGDPINPYYSYPAHSRSLHAG